MSFDMNKLLQQAQQMQEQMQKAQEELANETVETSAGGGMVTVKANGALEIVEIKISKDALDPDDVEMLEDLITAAIQDAMTKASTLAEDRMSALTGGIKIPGLT